MNRLKTTTACIVMGIGASSAQAVVIGQDDFDSNRDFVSFTQSPAAPLPENKFNSFGITSLADVTSDQQTLINLLPTVMTSDVDGNAFWVAGVDAPPGVLTWVFDTSGFENLELSFDLAGVTDNKTAPKDNFLLTSVDGSPFTELASQVNANGTMVFDGSPLSTTATEFVFPIAETGDELTVQFRIGGEVPTVTQYTFTSQLLFDNIQLTGDVVPEPGSLAFLGLGGMAMLMRRRRRA
jgi:hypothetical protein